MWFGSKSTDYYLNNTSSGYRTERRNKNGVRSFFRSSDSNSRHHSVPTHSYDTRYYSGLPHNGGNLSKPFHDLDYYQQQGHTFLPHPPRPGVQDSNGHYSAHRISNHSHYAHNTQDRHQYVYPQNQTYYYQRGYYPQQQQRQPDYYYYSYPGYPNTASTTTRQTVKNAYL
ncbi:hypothetical protein G6F57_005796 [Rhizopus arrhizus]|uniref:Uncharacterized protein n=1 Tax=Rhizopus oryzae TaxID=64495 RepID=A0A9P6X0L7_RHIOR|nr:hypothetical protein G6F23_000019 [Rhizopus arrhizus]KAG1419766.1 hypothetical protein G6F58_004460 [Rhizopus delemar]KAG0770535.1 hypothetical protein G6F24_000141 [Rhizopus arrhizus]KAG0780419.1 hypothetical protein G6F22_010097 [Rhizopus arrhizus]KAG0797353.1 hypothetical protein G6F21_000584 [Rhizopus arrhizus]